MSGKSMNSAPANAAKLRANQKRAVAQAKARTEKGYRK